MWNKIKTWIYGAVAAVIGFLIMLLHIKSKKIETLKRDVQKAEADTAVNKESVTLLEEQIKKERQLDETADSYNNMIKAWNNTK